MNKYILNNIINERENIKNINFNSKFLLKNQNEIIDNEIFMNFLINKILSREEKIKIIRNYEFNNFIYNDKKKLNKNDLINIFIRDMYKYQKYVGGENIEDMIWDFKDFDIKKCVFLNTIKEDKISNVKIFCIKFVEYLNKYNSDYVFNYLIKKTKLLHVYWIVFILKKN